MTIPPHYCSLKNDMDAALRSTNHGTNYNAYIRGPCPTSAWTSSSTSRSTATTSSTTPPNMASSSTSTASATTTTLTSTTTTLPGEGTTPTSFTERRVLPGRPGTFRECVEAGGLVFNQDCWLVQAMRNSSRAGKMGACEGEGYLAIPYWPEVLDALSGYLANATGKVSGW